MSNMMSRTDFGQTNEVHLTDTTVQNTINLYIFKKVCGNFPRYGPNIYIIL